MGGGLWKGMATALTLTYLVQLRLSQNTMPSSEPSPTTLLVSVSVIISLSLFMNPPYQQCWWRSSYTSVVTVAEVYVDPSPSSSLWSTAVPPPHSFPPTTVYVPQWNRMYIYYNQNSPCSCIHHCCIFSRRPSPPDLKDIRNPTEPLPLSPPQLMTCHLKEIVIIDTGKFQSLISVGHTIWILREYLPLTWL